MAGRFDNDSEVRFGGFESLLLSICDQNYEVALSLINEEFLNEGFIVDETLKQILEYKSSRDSIRKC